MTRTTVPNHGGSRRKINAITKTTSLAVLSALGLALAARAAEESMN